MRNRRQQGEEVARVKWRQEEEEKEEATGSKKR